MAEIEDLKIVGGSTYTVGNQDIIANEWEAGKTYVKNKSYVIREHRLYVCNVTHTSVEPFDATKWTEITIGDAIADNTTAIGDLSTLTTSVTSSLVGAVNEVNNRLGNRLVGAWTADTSSANNTYLTDEITVTAGTYLIIMSYPDISSTTFVASLYNTTTNAVYDNAYMFAQSLGTKAVLTAFSGTGKICIASAQSATCNFSNKNRGSIRAIKLSNLY